MLESTLFGFVTACDGMVLFISMVHPCTCSKHLASYIKHNHLHQTYSDSRTSSQDTKRKRKAKSMQCWKCYCTWI